jgi:rhamnosyl/mannosyltransferase
LCCHDKRLETREWINGVRVIRVPRWANFLSQPLVTRFFTRLEELQPDLLHVHVPFPFAWFAANQIYERAPIVCTWHSDIVRQRWLKLLYYPFERLFLSRCDRILPTSQPLLEHSQSLKRYAHKCTIMPLAIKDRPRPDEPLVQSIKAKMQKPIVLFTGRLVGYKGLPYLIRAMVDVDAVLLIAGEGALKKKLQNLVAHHRLHDKVQFLGYVPEDELTVLYQAADVFVLPSISRNEAFGYVLLDAMQQGCPLVTTNLTTGVTFVNQNQETGLVVKPKSAKALSEAINNILEDHETRKRYSINAKARVMQHFYLNAVVKKLEEVYWEMLMG